VQDVRKRAKAAGVTHPPRSKTCSTASLTELLTPLQKPLRISPATTVMLVAGVDMGETTSIGKLTTWPRAGRACCWPPPTPSALPRARQLGVWADRNTVEIISQQGADPAAVAFDAVSAGKARAGEHVVLVDTAGRLPTQLHLMDELDTMERVVQKADATAPHEVLLVIDGNTGQNALAQVRAFDDAITLTGLIVTKLDGTAKGGVLAAIARERPVPV